MRRTRGFAWYHLLLAVPIVALGFGIRHFAGGKSSNSVQSHSLSQAAKPSDPHQQKPELSAKAGETHKAEEAGAKTASLAKVAAKTESHAESHDTEKFEAALDATLDEHDRHRSVRGSARSLAKASAPVAPVAPAANEKPVTEKLEKPLAGHAPQSASVATVVSPDSSCGPAEFRGEGPSILTRAEDWERILAQYADAKRGLLEWLEHHRKGFPDKIAAFMEKQILSVKLQRPPVTGEPDLSWRGVGVFGYDGKVPTIRLGSGFARLAERNPDRARFELARLVAQSLAPCEIQREVASEKVEAWGPLLQCLQVAESQGCGKNSYSESGWAVSTTLAAAVAPPGCTPPIFQNPELARCIKKLPLPMPVANMAPSVQSNPQWKEARR